MLVHNGIDFDENATKESLETVVKCEILQIEDGELDDWEPPGDNDIQWKSPVSEDMFNFLSSRQSLPNPWKSKTDLKRIGQCS